MRQQEGDYEEWRHVPSNYKCEIRRNMWKEGTPLFEFGGFWCGYVTVPSKHKYYGKEYDNVPVSVHGGLTYGNKGKFGFDCAHYKDMIPCRRPNNIELYKADIYRTKQFVMDQTNSLASQLYELRGSKK